MNAHRNVINPLNQAFVPSTSAWDFVCSTITVLQALLRQEWRVLGVHWWIEIPYLWMIEYYTTQQQGHQ